MLKITDWQPEAIPFLDDKDYSQIVALYEQIVENDPEEINNYWYLGLAYLLANKIDEAQATWFLVFSQGEEAEVETWNQELLAILEEEATRQLNLSRYNESLSIRQQIEQISPENVNNLLHIVNLELLLETFDIENLTRYNLVELVKNSQPDTIDFLLLSTVLEDILKYPYNLSIFFAEAVLIYSNADKSIVLKIRTIGDSMAKEGMQTLYAIDLLEMCNKFTHQDINILKNLYAYYQLVKDFDKLIGIAEDLCNRADNYLDKLNGQDLLLNAYLTLAEWEKAIPLGKKQQQLYRQLNCHQEELANSPSRDTFIVGGMNLLYLQDDPRLNRKIINQNASLFQKLNQTHYQQVTHPQPKEKQVLKIGYLAHTLRNHSVGFLSRWLIYHHDRDLFDVNLYVTQDHQDEITENWFKPHVSQIFMAQRGMNKLIQKIREDEIDILVDLDSLTLNLTCIVMAMKPAPIQVTWLGMDATGIPNVDYFIADPYVLPDNAQEYYQERIWRLPDTYVAVDGFEIGYPTLHREDLALPNDAIVFLNVQNPAKLNPSLMGLQMQILAKVPNSYLVLKIRRDEGRLKKYVYAIAEKYQIAAERLRFKPLDDTVEAHRANLSIADVLLDTYPYNGATTTLESLWAELPVVTRVGEQFAARNTYGFMMNVGVTEGIAWSDEEYIEWGVKLGTDENLRRQVVWKLRQSKQTSPLWNGRQFTREMEQAYRQMWAIYLQNQNDARDIKMY